MDDLNFSGALEEIWHVVRRTNKYIDETTPWILAKDETNADQLSTVLYNLAESIRIIAVLIQPFMIHTAEIKAIGKEAPLEIKKQIEYDDFAKLDFKVAQVIKCEKHPKADRLLVLQLKVGPEQKQVVSGIAEFFKPDELVGKKVIWVANLKPIKLRGVESNGMILAAEKGDKLVLLSADIDDGAQVS